LKLFTGTTAELPIIVKLHVVGRGTAVIELSEVTTIAQASATDTWNIEIR